MSTRAVKSVVPFEFRGDFEAPAPAPPADEEERVSLNIAELAALLEDARSGAAELVRDEQVQIQADAMRDSAQALKSALANIVELAQILEKASISDDVRQDALTRVRHIATELVDGQGDLFQS